MDIGRAITYIFEDPNWLKKVLIGGLLMIIPIIGWAIVTGYSLRIVRNVIEGRDTPLPEWSDFGGDFIRGLKGFVVWFVWSLPAWILGGYSSIASLASGSDNPAVAVSGGAAGIGLQCLSTIVSLAVLFVQPLFLSRVAMTESVASGFEFGAIFDEARQHAMPLLIVVLMNLALNFLAAFGLILCVIGVVFTFFLTYVMLSHLYGQVRRLAQGEQPVPALY